MQVPIAEWTEAVEVRRSRRTYTGERLTDEQVSAITAHCESFRPFAAARAVFVERPVTDVFGGLMGSYGTIQRSPSVLVFIGDDSDPSYEPQVGYTGEAAVLEATRLGLGTCWIAGFFDRRKSRSLVELGPAERVMAVSPIGPAAAVEGTRARLVSGASKVQPRKSLSEIAPGIDGGGWPLWAFEGVRLARLAPSAMNRQPWTFRLESPDAVVVSVGKPGGDRATPKRLDCGIAMLHFELGALSEGGIGGWELTGEPDVARYRLLVAGDGGPDGRP